MFCDHFHETLNSNYDIYNLRINLKLTSFLKNNNIYLWKKNRYCSDLNRHKFTTIGNSTLLQGISSLCNENKQDVQKVIDNFLCFMYGLYPATCFNKLTHIHRRCFDNTIKGIPVASLVGLSTGILGSQGED